MQMAHVVAFDAAFNSITYDRIAKPFSPLKNESYEYDRTSDLGWRFVSELIEHYPAHFATVNIFMPLSLSLSVYLSIYLSMYESYFSGKTPAL